MDFSFNEEALCENQEGDFSGLSCHPMKKRL